MWCSASKSNIEKIQRIQNKILKQATGALWYIKNTNIHKDLRIESVEVTIRKLAPKYKEKLHTHSNQMARQLVSITSKTRLKRKLLTYANNSFNICLC